MKEAVAHDVVFMAAATDTGTVRKNNEDAYFFSKKEQLFVLCDGTFCPGISLDCRLVFSLIVKTG